VRPDGATPFSASDFRELLGDPEGNRDELAEFVGEENVDAALSILGLNAEVNETSTVSGGAVAGGVGKVKRRRIKRENMDLSTVDEVMRLIMERGIMR